MSKIKRIIEIDSELIEKIKNSLPEWGARYVTVWDATIRDAIKDSKPYDDSGDLISRSALKKDIEQGSYDSFEDLWDEVRKAIDNAQTVEISGLPKIHYDRGFIAGYEKGKAERPQGEWVFVNPLQANDGGAYMCSNCKTGDYGVETYYKYCPFCGAEMKGGAE